MYRFKTVVALHERVIDLACSGMNAASISSLKVAARTGCVLIGLLSCSMRHPVRAEALPSYTVWILIQGTLEPTNDIYSSANGLVYDALGNVVGTCNLSHDPHVYFNGVIIGIITTND